MLSSLRNIFKVPDLRNKVLFTILMIVLYRFGAHLPVPGIDIVGPFPGDLQKIIAYAATVLPGSTQRAAAQEFVKFLRSSEAVAIIKKKGMEPV